MALIKVTCTNSACASYRRVRSVRLEQVAIGVLARPTMICSGCLMIMADHVSEGSNHA